MKKTKLKTIDILQSNLLQYFKEYFVKIDEELNKSLKKSGKNQIDTLRADLKNPLQNLIATEKNHERILQERLNNSLLDESEKNKKIKIIYNNLEILRNLSNRIEVENS
jgi:exonuclease VII large subunit